MILEHESLTALMFNVLLPVFVNAENRDNR
ncbi:hypothetical protein C806_02445 [Lachnospiraceae bacterium 3-1]|nr:hypothetical protein C806_02445 [Lachnospiraceae bacterium 3-1]